MCQKIKNQTNLRFIEPRENKKIEGYHARALPYAHREKKQCIHMKRKQPWYKQINAAYTKKYKQTKRTGNKQTYAVLTNEKTNKAYSKQRKEHSSQKQIQEIFKHKK